MTPLVSALISFITFIASMMQTTVSSVTAFPTSTKGGASGEAARYNVPTIGDTMSFRGTPSIGFGVAVVGSVAVAAALGEPAAAADAAIVAWGAEAPLCSLRRNPSFSISN